MQLELGRELSLDVLKPVLGGDALARHEGMAVFVSGALPGQKVRARISTVKKRHAKADLLEVLEQSAEFIPPGCGHFGVCGGCDWLNMDYDRQLYWKRELVRESLHHIGGMDIEVAQTIPSPVRCGYRNKMEFAFAAQGVSGVAGQTVLSPGLALGLRPRGMANLTTPVRSCCLCPQGIVDVQEIVGQWARESGLEAYDTDTGQGFWRHLILRRGAEEDRILACLITADHPQGSDVGRRLAEHLQKHAPQVHSLVHDVRKARSLLAQGERTTAVYGPGELTHRLGNLQLTISSSSFFQTNTSAAEKLCGVVREFADLSGRESLWDLYSGVGGMALFLAANAVRVTGMEVSAQAVRDAEKNARRNAIENCRFLSGDVAKTMTIALQSETSNRPDVIIADPPRTGMHAGVVAQLLKIRAPKLILVSCNPATLARDVRLLSADYALRRVQPVDMFPHTSHIECVAELGLHGGGSTGPARRCEQPYTKR